MDRRWAAIRAGAVLAGAVLAGAACGEAGADGGAGAREACPGPLVDRIEACATGPWTDPSLDGPAEPGPERLAACSEARPVARFLDDFCVLPGAPAAPCEIPYAQFIERYLPGCRREARDRWLDAACVFGRRYRDLEGAAAATVVLWRRVMTADTPRTGLEERQIVAAVHATAHDDVATADEAFAAVDEGKVNQVEVWDASGRRAFTVYEVGAGDNSFGMYFRHGTTDAVARNNDGDVCDCTVAWGPERRPCETPDDCPDAMACVGVPAPGAPGQCVDRWRDAVPGAGEACAAEADCGDGTGLLCAGRSAGDGTCEPGWMRGRFATEPSAAVPEDAGGVEVALPARGLAAVATDVSLELLIPHPRTSDLRVTLVNPVGTEVAIFDGHRDGPELALAGYVVPGLPAGEPANGVWRLRVRDVAPGETGRVERVALTITSRWE
jgi:hypothetical protein